jgi:hypothetical protein
MHEGGYTLERSAKRGELCFRRPDGRRLSAVPLVRPVEQDDLERRNGRHGAGIGPDTCASRWAGDRLDLALNIDALVRSDRRLSEEPEMRAAGP